MKASTLGLGLTLALAAGVAQAQTPPPMQVPKAAQAAGPVLSKSSLSAKGADAILDAAVAEAVKNQWGMSIAIVDESGRLLAFRRTDGAPMGTIDVAQGKAVTAIKFKMPTRFVQEIVSKGGSAMLTIKDIVAITGGYPIESGGQIIGAIGVSGGLGDEDDRTAQAGLAVFPK